MKKDLSLIVGPESMDDALVDQAQALIPVSAETDAAGRVGCGFLDQKTAKRTEATVLDRWRARR